MIRAELSKMFRNRRTWATIALIDALLKINELAKMMEWMTMVRCLTVSQFVYAPLTNIRCQGGVDKGCT